MRVRIGLIAHDEKKDALVDWARRHEARLCGMDIFATGTTGGRIKSALPDLSVTALKSGPLGGDQQIGALIADERLDALIFFVDPLSPLPHDVDVKALTRLAIVYDLPLACSPSTADAVLDHMVQRNSNA